MKFLGKIFPAVTYEKVKAELFDGPQIRQLMNDVASISQMNETKKNKQNVFSAVVNNFLENFKAINYVELVNNVPRAYEKLGCNMSVRVHFFHSHLHYFPKNLERFSEEQERFHQNLQNIEQRHRGK